jgi:hypothetical protein
MRWGAAPLLVFLLYIVLSALPTSAPAASAIEIEPVVWQFADDYPGAHGDDASLPVRTVYLKTHDGTTWMSAWDQNPAAISGVERLREWIAFYNDRGIEVVAWFVPQGPDVEGQLAFAKAVIDAGVKGLYADVEAFPEFCYVDCAWLAHTFWVRLRAERPEARLGVIYDPRPWWWSAAGVDVWMANADVALPMCYWDSFNEQPPFNDPAGCVTSAHNDLGVIAPGRSLSYVPMLQGNSTPEKLVSAVQAAGSVGSTSVSIWRRGIVSTEAWNALGAGIPLPPPTPLPPPPPCLNDGCVHLAPDGSRHVIYAGARFALTDELSAQLGEGAADARLSEAVGMIPARPPEGTLFREAGRQQLFKIIGGALMPVAGDQENGTVHSIPSAALMQLPSAPADGTLLSEGGGRTLYLIVAGTRFPVDPSVLEPLGLTTESVRQVCRGGLSRIAQVPPGGSVLLETVPHSVQLFVSGNPANPAPNTRRIFRLLTGLAVNSEPPAVNAVDRLPGCALGVPRPLP